MLSEKKKKAHQDCCIRNIDEEQGKTIRVATVLGSLRDDVEDGLFKSVVAADCFGSSGLHNS